jgi:hypothetical protein
MKISKACATLALACAYWRLADEPRPLTPSGPAEDEDPTWDRETEALANEARRLMARVPDHAAALRALRDRGRVGEAARAEARAVVGRRFPSLGSVAVRAFGPGSRELGSVTV